MTVRGPLRSARGLAAAAAIAAFVVPGAGCGEDVLVGRLDDATDAAVLLEAGAPPRRDAGGATDGGCDEGGCDGGDVDGGPGPSAACSGKACGERCSTCTGTICPAVVETCDAIGRCGLEVPVCAGVDAGPAYQPCSAKLCGDPCTLCRPGDATCVETAVPKFCQPDLRTCRDGVPPCAGP